jgi:nicotinamidase-related amidase
MQWKFLNDEQISNEELEKLVTNQKKVLEYCKVREIPVFVVEYYNEGETIAELKNILYKISKKTRVIKQSDNAFSGTNLEWLLHRMEIHTLFVMGVATHKCVQKTVFAALDAEFKVITSTNTMHPMNLKLSGWYKKHATITEDMFDTLVKQRI